MHTLFFSFFLNHYCHNNIVYTNREAVSANWRASETVLGVDNAKSGICYWRASVASETLTGVTQLKIGDVCLFIYMFGRMYVILYFDPPYFCVRSAFDPVPNFTKQNPLV